MSLGWNMNVDPAALLVGLAALIVALGATAMKRPVKYWVFGSCAVLATIAIAFGVIGFARTLSSASASSEDHVIETTSETAVGRCTSDYETKLMFNKKTNGPTITFSVEVKCSPLADRTCNLIMVELNSGGEPCYHLSKKSPELPGVTVVLLI